MAEKLVAVFADTFGSGRCRSCDAKIAWYTTTLGKAMPFDGEPVARKSEYSFDGTRLVLHLSAEDSHWTTCPDANKFKSRGR